MTFVRILRQEAPPAVWRTWNSTCRSDEGRGRGSGGYPCHTQLGLCNAYFGIYGESWTEWTWRKNAT